MFAWLCGSIITQFIPNVPTVTGSGDLFFHKMLARAELFIESENKIETYLSHLAIFNGLLLRVLRELRGLQ